MQQQELASIVDGLKSEFSKAPRLNRKSIADRANSANIAALDLLLEGVEAEENKPTSLEQAKTLRALSNEFTEIADVIENLARR